MWASTSARKYFKISRNAVDAVWPRPQLDTSDIASDIFCMTSRSLNAAAPSEIRFISSYNRRVPMRQGVHLQQHSFRKKRRITLAKSTTHVSSSQTSNAPEPSDTPALRKESKSSGVSCRLAGTIVPLDPPV